MFIRFQIGSFKYSTPLFYCRTNGFKKLVIDLFYHCVTFYKPFLIVNQKAHQPDYLVQRKLPKDIIPCFIIIIVCY